MDNTKQLTKEALSEHVVPLVATHWHSIGLELGLTREIMRSIVEMNLQQDVYVTCALHSTHKVMEKNAVRKSHCCGRQLCVQDTMKCEAVFNKWLETSDSASWDHLIKAIKSIRLDDVAEKMQMLLQIGNSTTAGMQSCKVSLT